MRRRPAFSVPVGDQQLGRIMLDLGFMMSSCLAARHTG
jgi:hypothetical protein